MVEVTDQIGNQIQVPKKVQRIISLVPSITELLFDFGLHEEIVGVTKFCIHPGDKTHHKPKVGGTKKLDLDAIRKLEPELVIANKEENTKEQIEELQKELPVWVSDVNSITQAMDMIDKLGAIVKKQKAADIMMKRIDGEFDKLSQKPFELKANKVAYLIWNKPYMVAGSNTFINDVIEKGGFENVFGGQERYPEVTAKDLTDSKPDFVLLSSEPFPFDHTHFAEFREHCPDSKVFLVDGEMFSWYGSHLIKTPGYCLAFQRSLNLLT